MKFWKIIKKTIKYFILIVLCFLTALYIEHFFSTDLPRPSGQFHVGVTSLRVNGKLPTNELPREAFCWIWYPSDQDSGIKSKYLPQDWLEAVNDRKSFISNFFIRDLAKVQTNSFQSPTISHKNLKYPVIIFRGGLSTLAPEYSSLCENWASHGYIVIGIDAPKLSRVYLMADGEVVERSDENNPELYPETVENFDKMIPRMADEWANLATISINYMDSLSQISTSEQIYKKMDFENISMIGHSLGGTAALQFSIQDNRCKFAVNIDGLYTKSIAKKGLNKNTLLIIADHSDESETSEPLDKEIRSNLRSLIKNTPDSLISIENLNNANHFNFSDGAVTKSHLLMAVLRLFGIIKMNPIEQLQITGKLTIDFLESKSNVTK